MMKKVSNKRGAALVTSLYISAILIGLAEIFVVATLHEMSFAQKELAVAKAHYTAQAAAEQGLDQIDTLINGYLLTTVSNANPSGVSSFSASKVAAGEGVEWLVYAVRDNNVPVLLQNGEEATYTETSTTNGITYTYTIVFTEKSDPEEVSPEVWDFPFSFHIDSIGTYETVAQSVHIHGDFVIRVQKDNFAKYALFTNSQTTKSGSNVWFTDKTNFAGPIHTNNRFNFAFNPSGIFEEQVTQEELTARFYNNGFTTLLDDDHNSTKDVPTFNNGFVRDTNEITLSSATVEQDMVDQAQGNGGNFASDGIYVPANGSTLKGGIYIKGDSTIALSVVSNLPVYTVTQGANTKQITVDQVNQETTVVDVTSGNSDTYSGIPDGTDDVGTLIFVDGDIDGLSGTVQSDTEVTIASSDNINISDSIVYSSYTSAVGSPGDVGYTPPLTTGETNLLGIVSWNGDVNIAPSAPDDVNIHGTILALDGVFQVEDYNDTGVGPRGTATLLGGAVTDNYGAFGLFNGSTGNQLSGYGRNFVYDQRMSEGKSPPYFPSLNTFIAFTNDITDKLAWQEGD